MSLTHLPQFVVLTADNLSSELRKLETLEPLLKVLQKRGWTVYCEVGFETEEKLRYYCQIGDGTQHTISKEKATREEFLSALEELSKSKA